MNFDGKLPITFKEAVDAADKVMYKKHRKLRRLSKLLISSKSRNFAYFCYYYLRWIDDYVDEKSFSIEKKNNFFEKQINLVLTVAKGKETELIFIEEYFLYYFIKHIHSQGKPEIVDSLLIMLDTIRMDLYRLKNNGIFTESDLHKYLEGQSISFFRITNFFLLPNEAYKYDDKFGCLYTIIYLSFIKDFAADLNLGYINISNEDIQKYQLDTADLINEHRLKDWYSDKFAEYKDRTDEEMKIVKNFPTKLKIFWFWLFPYCYHKMNRIIMYNYDLKNLKNRIVL